MKIAVIIVRTLVGLMFLFASISYFFNLAPTPTLSGPIKIFMDGLVASGYLLPFIKGTELVCAIAFISGRFVALAAVVIFPVMLNIIFVNAKFSPEGLTMTIPLLVGILFLAYANREKYIPMLQPK